MIVEIILCSISMKVWDQARIELTASGPAVRHITNCTMGPGKKRNLECQDMGDDWSLKINVENLFIIFCPD